MTEEAKPNPVLEAEQKIADVATVRGGNVHISIDRVVAWAGPLIAIGSSSVATWLLVKVNIFNVPGFDKSNLPTWIAAGTTFVLTAGLHALGGWKWLKGRHIMLEQGKE